MKNQIGAADTSKTATSIDIDKDESRNSPEYLTATEILDAYFMKLKDFHPEDKGPSITYVY